ncbi:hypothetical protein [Absidia glauca]|uniref:Uncharacterized protein n=1 Tax=Absidia glauca TaxID=4829 RepID=A0A168RYA9_ABSGL|nr:hypothetical protein [Absidia glauca]
MSELENLKKLKARLYGTTSSVAISNVNCRYDRSVNFPRHTASIAMSMKNPSSTFSSFILPNYPLDSPSLSTFSLFSVSPPPSSSNSSLPSRSRLFPPSSSQSGSSVAARCNIWRHHWALVIRQIPFNLSTIISDINSALLHILD